MAHTIDLNSDLGEAFGSWTMGDDLALLDVVTSANVACGFHAGDASVMLATCQAAAQRGIRIGAHVAYRDLAGFGRRRMDYSLGELRAETLYQIGALSACARAAGTDVSYVKPHGALYNRIAVDEGQAAAVVEAMLMARSTCGEGLAIMAQPGSVIERMAVDAGLPVIREAFADRAYNADGTLVSRSIEGSVITDSDQVLARVIAMARGEAIRTIDGDDILVNADSVCVHGDTPGAVVLSERIRAGLESAGIAVTSGLRWGAGE
nr:5-oxoprolinase subunit PxpA [Corynebacterium lactis]